jgi:hypothetical protein
VIALAGGTNQAEDADSLARQSTGGGWRMEDGGWRMEDGVWRKYSNEAAAPHAQYAWFDR